MIKIKNLCKSFGKNQVLCDITETINQGDKIVVIGPSGSGKSTFLRCLNCMEDPTSGSIFFDGEDLVLAAVFEQEVFPVAGLGRCAVDQGHILFHHFALCDDG